MTTIKPSLSFDDLDIDDIDVVPATIEDLTQGHAMTELAASCGDCNCDCAWDRSYHCLSCRIA